MKILFPVISIVILLLSCNNSSTTTVVPPAKETPVKQKFFPVTYFLKGEINTLKTANVNPVKYTTINDHTDSVWLKIEDMDAAFYEFLHPEIDTGNLVNLFTEKSFLDQTINAVTFTYDATMPPLPDSMQLQHWDVYVDPVDNTVKRVYLLKEVGNNKILQLTWVTKKWCKITSIVTDKKGESKIEKEEKIFWDF